MSFSYDIHRPFDVILTQPETDDQDGVVLMTSALLRPSDEETDGFLLLPQSEVQATARPSKKSLEDRRQRTLQIKQVLMDEGMSAKKAAALAVKVLRAQEGK